MTKLYASLILFSCSALIIMMVLIYENARMRPATKKRLYLTYSTIILASLTEAAAIFLNGAPAWTRNLHLAIKGLDYTLTPLVGFMFVRQIQRDKKWSKILLSLLIANALLQVVSFFTGWTYFVDAENYYHHGPLYGIFAFIYTAIMAFAAWQFLLYSRRFKNSNRLSLYLIVLFLIAGIAVQEIYGAQVVYVALAMGAILLFIHNNEYNQQMSDSTISEQKTLLETDVLTGMKSRYAYNEALNTMSGPDSLPSNSAVFMIDINGLKQVNDQHGHSAGDELIQGTAQCISEVFSPYGECYRTGGDEFVAILHGITESSIGELCSRLLRVVNEWRGELIRKSSVSYGYVCASECPGYSAEALVRVADERMYWCKDRYYKGSGHNRRRS